MLPAKFFGTDAKLSIIGPERIKKFVVAAATGPANSPPEVEAPFFVIEPLKVAVTSPLVLIAPLPATERTELNVRLFEILTPESRVSRAPLVAPGSNVIVLVPKAEFVAASTVNCWLLAFPLLL